MRESKITTPHREFLRATKNGETRFYALTRKDEAVAFDEKRDPVAVSGFAVYDTSISTSYAVGLYATIEAADAHQVIKPDTTEPEVFNKLPETPPPAVPPATTKRRRR